MAVACEVAQRDNLNPKLVEPRSPSANVSADARIQTTAAPPITAAARHLQVTVPRPPAVIGLGTSSKDGGGSGLKERERQRIRETERTKCGGAADATRGHLIADVVQLLRCACEPAQRVRGDQAPTHALRPHNAYGHFGWLQPTAPPPQHSSSAAPAAQRTPRRRRAAPQTRRCLHHTDRRARFCGIFLRDGNLARSVRAETALYAREELSCLESALQHVRWLNASRSAVDAACDALRVAEESARFVVAAVGEGVGVNDDEATFPGVHSTCAVCREKEVDGNTEHGRTRNADRERVMDRDGRGALLLRALGANTSQPGAFAAPEPMMHATLATFVDLAEGTVNHVLVVASERAWLRAQTRWAELTRQALAAHKFTAGSGGGDRGFADVDSSRGRGRTRTDVYANNAVNAVNAAAHGSAGYTNTSADESTTKRDSELEDEPSEDEDEMAAVLESSVKEMALGDWARGRILDGVCVDPADVYYGSHVGGLDTLDNPVKAIRPVPWVVSPPPSPPGHATSTAALSTPLPLATRTGPPVPPPPRYTLTEAAHGVHLRGAESVVSLVEEDDGLTARERYWQVEEEGPGAAEREMALVEMLMQYRYNGGGDVGDFSDVEDFEEKEGAGRGKYALGPAPAAWVAGAGRQHFNNEPGYEGGVDDARAHAARGGTPPKQANREARLQHLPAREARLGGARRGGAGCGNGQCGIRPQVCARRRGEQPAPVLHAGDALGRGAVRRGRRGQDPPPRAQQNRRRRGLSSHIIAPTSPTEKAVRD
ncbi:hypothetical protein DFH09DRAFT_1293872 [Mycena vulgaris]|nr:hypothetical protein DFH09DRAFT_1293872 [Mycena vulgaris]